MLFRSPAWWNQKKMHTKQLQIIQNKALRWICAAFKTTPITAMELEASIPPIQLHLDYLQRRAAVRLNGLPTNSQVISRLPPAWQDRTNPNPNGRQRRPKTLTQLWRLSRLSSPLYKRTDIFALPPWAPSASDYHEIGRAHV